MQSNSTSQAIDAVFQGQFLLDYTGLSALVFFAYDHILSISREVQLIWRKNFRVTTSLYLATRYLPLPLLVVQLLPLISTPNQETCFITYITSSVLSIFSRIAIIMVLTSQIYAIYNRNRIILVVLGTLGFSILVLDVLQVTSGSPCAVADLDENIFNFRELLSSISQLIFAASVMVLSLYKAYGIVAMLGGIKNASTESRFKLIWLIIIEGSRRLIVCGLIILQTLFLLLAPTGINGLVNSFSLPIEAILVSRLLLDLREAEQTTDGSTSSPVFTTIPMDADGPLTDTLDYEEYANQAFAHFGPPYTMDVSLNFDNEPQRRGTPQRPAINSEERDETTQTRIDVSEAYLSSGKFTELRL